MSVEEGRNQLNTRRKSISCCWRTLLVSFLLTKWLISYLLILYVYCSLVWQVTRPTNQLEFPGRRENINYIPERVKVFDENWEPFPVGDQPIGKVGETVRRYSNFSWPMFRQIRSQRNPNTTSPTHPPSPFYNITQTYVMMSDYGVIEDSIEDSIFYLISRSHLFPAMIIGTRLGVFVFLFPRNDCWLVVCRPPPMWHLVSMICDRRRATSSNDSRLSTLNTKRNRSPK